MEKLYKIHFRSKNFIIKATVYSFPIKDGKVKIRHLFQEKKEIKESECKILSLPHSPEKK